MSLLQKFIDRVDYDSYEDLYENFKIHIPDNFNFAYDVVDVYAQNDPKKSLSSGATTTMSGTRSRSRTSPSLRTARRTFSWNRASRRATASS